jgi:hypothetical protein
MMTSEVEAEAGLELLRCQLPGKEEGAVAGVHFPGAAGLGVF